MNHETILPEKMSDTLLQAEFIRVCQNLKTKTLAGEAYASRIQTIREELKHVQNHDLQLRLQESDALLLAALQQKTKTIEQLTEKSEQLNNHLLTRPDLHARTHKLLTQVSDQTGYLIVENNDDFNFISMLRSMPLEDLIAFGESLRGVQKLIALELEALAQHQNLLNKKIVSYNQMLDSGQPIPVRVQKDSTFGVEEIQLQARKALETKRQEAMQNLSLIQHLVKTKKVEMTSVDNQIKLQIKEIASR